MAWNEFFSVLLGTLPEKSFFGSFGRGVEPNSFRTVWVQKFRGPKVHPPNLGTSPKKIFIVIFYQEKHGKIIWP